MQLPKDLASLSELLLKLPHQKIAKTISALLLCYIAYLAAQLTWLFVPQDTTTSLIVGGNASSSLASSQTKVDLTALNRLNLFGVFNEKEKVVEVKVQDAPETKLRLTLSGTVASDDPAIASAVIENNGKQETYGIGDKITGTRATLESVATDRVLLKQSGQLETLMLDGFKYDQRAQTFNIPQHNPLAENEPSPQVIDQRNNKDLSESAKQLKEDINEDPGKIGDYLKIVPKRQDGEIIGYQLMPGQNPQFFQSSGLKSGDIAVQMNGLDLTNPNEAAQALQALKQDTELSLLVERDGEMTEILFSIEE